MVRTPVSRHSFANPTLHSAFARAHAWSLYNRYPGIGVLVPNVRGSPGYGKGYQKLVQRDLGGNDIEVMRDSGQFFLDHLPGSVGV